MNKLEKLLLDFGGKIVKGVTILNSNLFPHNFHNPLVIIINNFFIFLL